MRALLCSILLSISGCDALWAGSLKDVPGNCVQDATACAEGFVCNQMKEICEPTIVLREASPALGPTSGGTVITLKGIGFTPGMQVTFDGVPATDITIISDQEIRVTIPQLPRRHGYVPVVATAPTKVPGTNTKLFSYYLSNVSFMKGNTYNSEGARNIVISDFNLDKIPDIVHIDTTDNSVRLLLGKGDGSFTLSTGKQVLPIYANQLAATDLNQDGKPDLVMIDSAGKLAVALGNGDGTMQTPTTSTLLSYPRQMAIADVNNDSFPDVAVTVSVASTPLQVMLGSKDSQFQSKLSATPTINPVSCAFGNFGTGNATDLALGDFSTSSIYIAKIAGDGTYNLDTNQKIDTKSIPPGLIAVADLNNDGRSDLLISDRSGSSTMATVILMNASGPKVSQIAFPAADPPGPVVTVARAIDIDYDGNADIVGGVGYDLAGLLNDRNNIGSFQTDTAFRIAADPLSILDIGFGDFNNDGLVDIAALISPGDGQPFINIFLNTST